MMMRRMMTACFLPPACCLGVAACGERITNANIDVVNRQLDLVEKADRGGVSPKEVESILGPPTRIETTTLPLETQKKEIEVVRYFYRQDGKTIELHFYDNKLISHAPHFDETPSPAGGEERRKQP